jgi:TonB family protein
MPMKTAQALIAATVTLLSVLGRAPLHAQSLDVISLRPPAYPAIARAARVWGEVVLKISVRADGAPEDVQVVNGPAMLQQAALDSAKGSRFRPVQDSNPETSFELTYRFILEVLNCDQEPDSSYPRFQYASNTITVSGQAITLCDPGGYTRVRSLKCFYLWRCSVK